MSKRRISPTIELIPLIDTMFLLLVFFIYAAISLTTTKQLPVNLPKVMKAIRVDKDYDQIVISKDKILLNEREVSLTKLKELSKEKKVYIAADKDVVYQDIVEVLNILKSSGVSSISLETK